MILFSAGPIPLRIREARVPIVNDNECVRKINTVTEKIFILPASSFCAGGERGHDACQVKFNLLSTLKGCVRQFPSVIIGPLRETGFPIYFLPFHCDMDKTKSSSIQENWKCNRGISHNLKWIIG